jgi:CxxC-x17-CxxC domain-containing protein
MAYEDRILRCVACGLEFVFTAEEQERFAQRGYGHEPKRCRACREDRRAKETPSGEREFHPAVCAGCGRECHVPFRPRPDRPVYCADCFREQQRDASSR